MRQDITLGKIVNSAWEMFSTGQIIPFILFLLNHTFNALLDCEAVHFLEEHDEILSSGKRRFVRNGYEVKIVSSIFGELILNIPKIRDRLLVGEKNKYSSKILKSIESLFIIIKVLIPFFWIKGISLKGINSLLNEIIGSSVKGISTSNLNRLINGSFDDMVNKYNTRLFFGNFYKFIYADGSYYHIKGVEQKICVIALMGVTEGGIKEVLRLMVTKSESKEEWVGVFNLMKKQGLNEPEAIIGDGGKGLWAAVDEVFKNTKKLQCWVHKCRDIMSYLPKKNKKQMKIMALVKNIYNSPNLEEALKMFNIFKNKIIHRYPKAVKTIEDNLDYLLGFYHFPVEYHKYLRTSNMIESLFSVIRHRTNRFRGCCNQKNLLDVMIYYAIQTNNNLTPFDLSAPEPDPLELALASPDGDESARVGDSRGDFIAGDDNASDIDIGELIQIGFST
jgi:transposase-like protein